MNDFNAYMESFKKYTLREKQDIVLEQLKVLTSLSYPPDLIY